MAKASDLQARAQSIVTAASEKLAPLHFLKVSAAAMSREDVDALAVAYLYGQVKGRKRRETLNVERDAETRTVEPNWGTNRWGVWAAVPENAERAEKTRQYQSEAQATRDHYRRESDKGLTAIIGTFMREVRTQWTAELLESKFALGDGTETRWGEATREDHAYRIGMHKRNAVAGIEGAARHQQAIEAIDAAGCRTLNESLKVAA
ncbi:hypothetical protein D6T64_12020 [Cryobacterium melibiosiphilum]|uniref:Uncharacterized protein n=1 Tax=Cryobacterium melibiosiphilum TaxID=995039 RepID=A0A3A5MJL2_9MICO|nr:hypothetical protein [Cryobacterium melibiosiphilum]RJT88109.1 hypothetical protein D6T64_12020 [Cryobacterium melibiosiphilum]